MFNMGMVTITLFDTSALVCMSPLSAIIQCVSTLPLSCVVGIFMIAAFCVFTWTAGVWKGGLWCHGCVSINTDGALRVFV